MCRVDHFANFEEIFLLVKYIEIKDSSYCKLSICVILSITFLSISEVIFNEKFQPYVSVLKSQKTVAPNGEKYSGRAV